MKKNCLILVFLLLLSVCIPVTDGYAQNDTKDSSESTTKPAIFSGGAIDSHGKFSLTAEQFMDELIGLMNSETVLKTMEKYSYPMESQYSYEYQDERFIILFYKGLDLGAVSFLKDGKPVSGDSNFDAVGIQLPLYNEYYMETLINAGSSAIFLTAPACIYQDAVTIFAALSAKCNEVNDNGHSSYSIDTDLFTYSVDRYQIDEEENIWQYLFTIWEIK